MPRHWRGQRYWQRHCWRRCCRQSYWWWDVLCKLFFFQDLHPPGASQDPQSNNKKSGRMSTFFKKNAPAPKPIPRFSASGGDGQPRPPWGPSERKRSLAFCLLRVGKNEKPDRTLDISVQAAELLQSCFHRIKLHFERIGPSLVLALVACGTISLNYPRFGGTFHLNIMPPTISFFLETHTPNEFLSSR